MTTRLCIEAGTVEPSMQGRSPLLPRTMIDAQPVLQPDPVLGISAHDSCRLDQFRQSALTPMSRSPTCPCGCGFTKEEKMD